MRVCVVYCPAPRQAVEYLLELPDGATARQAIQASGLLQECPDLQDAVLEVGIWGRQCGPDDCVEDGDRLEIYRPLRVDPKVARRERFARQGARSAGLFARRRPGAKPGY